MCARAHACVSISVCACVHVYAHVHMYIFSYNICVRVCVHRNTSVGGTLVEESQGEVTFLVYRSFGTFGEVNVTWGTEQLNDNALPGLDYLDE